MRFTQAQAFAALALKPNTVPRKDSMVVQSNMRLTHPSNFFIKAELAGEFFRSDYSAVNLGLRLGFEF